MEGWTLASAATELIPTSYNQYSIELLIIQTASLHRFPSHV